MPRSVLASAIVASLFAAAAATLPNRVLAFDTDNTTADAIPGTATSAQEPDEKLQLTTPNDPLQELKSDESSGAPSSSGSTLQLGGATLQITGGTGPMLGLQSGTPMGPVIDNSNPADNRSLIPTP
jgi:hypothetical protein